MKVKNFAAAIEERKAKNVAMEKKIAEAQAEIEKLDALMVEAVQSENEDVYADLAEKKFKLNAKIEGMNKIIETMGRGYTDEDVLEAWEAIISEKNKKLEKMTAEYKASIEKLFDEYFAIAKAQNDCILVLNDMKNFFAMGKDVMMKNMDFSKFKKIYPIPNFSVPEMSFFGDVMTRRGIDSRIFVDAVNSKRASSIFSK